jgi:glycosyltransferase involved in cell wall biosynthesis
MRVALCYDRINKYGGAERVLQALHSLWPEAPVYTLTYSPQTALWAKGWDIRSSFLQKIPLLGHIHELFPPLAPLAWEHFDFTEYDLIVSVTSSEAKSILIRSGATHICYCLTPTRYYWSGYFNYLQNPGMGILNFFIKYIFPFFAHVLRVYDFYHAQRPTIMVGISHVVAERIQKYYRRHVTYIYPPVIQGPRMDSSVHDKRYFLVVSRLVPYKRIDIVIDAFNKLQWPLRVVGVGSEEAYLKKKARENIVFGGFVTEEDLDSEYRSAIAVVFPTDEDFGIVPLEAQAHGIPVVALRRGGALETIKEGVTGCYFDTQDAESLYAFLYSASNGGDFSSAIAYFSRFSPEDCVANSSQFSSTRFQDAITALVRETIPSSSL